MNKRIPLLPLLVLAGGLCAAGCQKTDSDAPAGTPLAASASASSVTTPPVTNAPRMPTQTASATPLKDALSALFDHENNTASSSFPRGARLLSVELKDKTALVDVSKEFNQLQNKGESNEGQVQRHLCATLARFPSVDTLHLTVEGKDYESQAADWRSIPVRAGSDTSVSSPASSASSSASSLSGGVQTAGSLDR